MAGERFVGIVVPGLGWGLRYGSKINATITLFDIQGEKKGEIIKELSLERAKELFQLLGNLIAEAVEWRHENLTRITEIEEKYRKKE